MTYQITPELSLVLLSVLFEDHAPLNCTEVLLHKQIVEARDNLIAVKTQYNIQLAHPPNQPKPQLVQNLNLATRHLCQLLDLWQTIAPSLDESGTTS